MTIDPATPEPPSPKERQRHDDEPLRVPEWMRQREVVHPVGAAERFRLFWEERLGVVSVLGAVLAVAVLVSAGWLLLRQWAGEPPQAYPTISPPPGVSATSDATAPPPADAFAGTPAASFAEGAAGITLPPARQSGEFSARQVAASLADVRAAMVLARLDRRFLTGGEQDRFLKMFAPDARVTLREDFRADTFASFATRLAPGARLTDDQPRVKGRVTYRATRDSDGIRVLEITTNFIWVYAFRTTDPTPGAGLVVVHDTVVWQVPHSADVTAASDGLWLWEADSYAANIDCAAYDKGLLDLGIPVAGVPVPAEGPEAIFDPDRSLDLPDTC